MKASVVDLRYKMKNVLEALRRNETVDILYHGKVTGTIYPAGKSRQVDAKTHPFFGMYAGSRKNTSVKAIMDKLREDRFAHLRKPHRAV